VSIPKASILLPVRNEGPHLPAALASLRRQTFTDWELVAVDDGSTDATPDILSAAASSDRRIRVLSRPAEGLVAALNAGLAACRGDLVARMDGDDICHPGRLERQREFLLHHPQVDLVATRIRYFPRSGLTDGLLAYEAWVNSHLDDREIRRDLFVESPFPHPSVMVRRRVLEAVGGYRDMGWPEDYDLWLRLAEAGCRFARVPEALLFWRDRSGRLSRIGEAYSPEAFRACKIHHLQRNFLAGIKEVALWGAGMEGKAWRKSLAGAGIRVTRWYEVDPRKVGQTIHGASVVSLSKLAAGSGPVLVTIGVREARPQVRAWAGNNGLMEGRDFVCVT